MTPKPWHYYVTIICLVSGLLLSWQFRAYSAGREASLQTKSKETNLLEVIGAFETEIQAQEASIEQLRANIDDIQKKKGSGQNMAEHLQAGLDNLRKQIGLTEVEGQGIIVTVDDNQAGAKAAKKADMTSYNPNDFIVHFTDVLYLVKELQAAGAEAIAVNNQRAGGTSDIRCVGTVIMVNSTRMAPPYIISAIGNPDVLEPAITYGQEMSYLKARGFPVKITKEGLIRIPPYKGSLNVRYMQKTKP